MLKILKQEHHYLFIRGDKNKLFIFIFFQLGNKVCLMVHFHIQTYHCQLKVFI